MDWNFRSEDYRRSTLRALQDRRVTLFDLWVFYYAVGGELDTFSIEAYFYGLMTLPELENLLLVEAVNEVLAEETPS